ncbi:MAG TPA: protease pro-enzyme activation domain-containing protein [Ktedonobacteraceae bacterium]|nr:protease pro-enzyme activation domain-containing protein [Ktedonobacteraceae bacterium]
MQRSRWFICVMLVVMLLCLGVPLFLSHLTFASPSASSSAVDAVSPLVARSQVVGNVDPQSRLSMSINLNLRNQSELKQYVQALYTSGSYLYHHYLHPSEFAAQYGPTAQDVQQVADYLRAQGFTVTRANAGQQIIDFSGTAAQAQQAFAVQLHTYRARNGRVFYANSSAPRVPLALRSLILNINGLSNAVVYTHPPLPTKTITTSGAAKSPRTPSCPVTGSNYYTPAQLATAYNYTGAYNAGLHGEGQSIALFELDSYTPSDISNFEACFDPNTPTRINTEMIDGGPGPQGAGGLEVELDMEVVLGMLHNLTNLFVYEAPNNDTGYNDEWVQILADDIPVVSTSWGTCEAGVSGSDITAEEQFFIQASAQGQSLLAASGDSGAFDCGDGTLAVDDPASNPYMTGVGGTHLTINSNNGTYNNEVVWSDPSATPTPEGSGGGISMLWGMPSYQQGPGVISSNSSNTPCNAASGQYCREVPDISLNADPAVGYVVYCTITAAFCTSTSSSFYTVGGTSAAAPMWAAIIALTDQYALQQGGNNLGFLNPLLYTLLNSSTLYGRAFHDVTSGTNLNYPATTGYDMASGIGTANAYAFVIAAISLPQTRAVPGSTKWYLAEGHVGNHFQEWLTLENPSVSSVAHVVVNYLLHAKAPLSQSMTLNPSTRTTINVNNVLGVNNNSNVGQDVSLYITSDIPIVAERPIYFDFLNNTLGGSDIVGQTQTSMHYTFANGETLPGFYTFITALNPLGQPTATVTVSYFSGGSMIGQASMTIPAGQRNTLVANNTLPVGKSFYIQVDSTQPVVVERPLYFRTSVGGVASLVQGGSSVQGVTPAASWYYAGGSTGSSGNPSQEYLILANPDVNSSGTSANVTITYSLPGGTTSNVTVSVPAKSQLIENVNTDVGSSSLVAMKVTSTNGIAIASERQQFFSSPSLVPTPSGVDEVGVTPGTPGLPTVYSFAEGHLGNTFSENITLFNPNNAAITVAVTYFVSRQSARFLSQETIAIPANGVVLVNSNTFLNVQASLQGAIPEDTSIVVQSLPANGGVGPTLPVVAERSLYFNFLGSIPGETSVVGYSGG